MHARARPIAVATLLALGLASATQAQTAAGTAEWRFCAAPLEASWVERARLDASESVLDADSVDVRGKDVYVLRGDVTVQQPGRWLGADQISFTHSSSDYRAEGSVRYLDAQIAITAAQAEGNSATATTELRELEYQLRGMRGNGAARSAEVAGDQAMLQAFSYSTCDPSNRVWQLRAESVKLDQAAGFGSARNATLRVGEVPILWLPYARFPIDDRRHTGFLYPMLGYADDSGIDFRLPLYLNLAPNMDATLTPRVLGRRGAMLNAEFRYLGARHGGQIDASWLPDDDQTGRDRGAFRFRHNGQLAEYWRLDTDLNDVSDDRYFEDFGDSLSGRSISLLASHAGVYGRGPGWWANLEARHWDLIDPLLGDFSEPYRELPRLGFGLDRMAGEHLRFGLRGDLVAFSHRVTGLESYYARGDANRYDLEPWIELPFERAAGYVRPRLAFRQTGYQLSGDWLRSLGECEIFDCEFAPPRVYPDRSPSRSTPIGSIDAALNFERPSRLFGEDMLQTLQPRMYYLRVPYEAQDDIPLFDTRELTFGFDQLFRTNRFSGADRQADANQLTLALSSRWFTRSNGHERLGIHAGQIRYFDDLRVQAPFQPTDRRSASAYVAGVDLHPTDAWSLSLAQQWDPEVDHSTLSGAQLSWRGDQGALANLAYRYRRAELEQVDGSFVLPVQERWRLVGRWNYSLREQSTLEAFAGVEWESCCIAWRVLGRHYVRNREGDKSNALFVEMELKGLGSFGRATGDFLQRAILGYAD